MRCDSTSLAWQATCAGEVASPWPSRNESGHHKGVSATMGISMQDISLFRSMPAEPLQAQGLLRDSRAEEDICFARAAADLAADVPSRKASIASAAPCGVCKSQQVAQEFSVTWHDGDRPTGSVADMSASIDLCVVPRGVLQGPKYLPKLCWRFPDSNN